MTTEAGGRPLWALSASRLSELVSRGELSSREIVRAHLDRIDDVEPKIRAFTAVFRERAIADASRADEERARGIVRGPLHGLPVSVKECFDMAGLATTLGIPSWRDRIAQNDAAMVIALREAGAVIVGRTNLSQTMLFVESRNPIFGQTANPFSLAHTPGGSSGGEAAAIAAGMTPLGLGTDIGGSIRTPCHFTGIAGLKPTLDRLPARGQRTVLAGQEVVRSQCGPMARTVADLTLFMRAFDARRLGALDARVPPVAWIEPSSVNIARLRIGVYVNDGIVEASAAVVRAVTRAAEALTSRGAAVVPFTPPAIEELIDTYLAALTADGARTFLETFREGEIDPVLLPLKRIATLPAALRRAAARLARLTGEPRTARLLASMGEKRVDELWQLTARIRDYQFTLLDAMKKARLDLLLCPAYATPALPHGGAKNFTLASSYAMLFNAAQLPAGVVPITRVRRGETERRAGAGADSIDKIAIRTDAASAGLPVGVQIVGGAWEDFTVLAAMEAIEAEVANDAEFPQTPVMNI